MTIRRATFTVGLLAASVIASTATATAAPEAAPEAVGFHTNLSNDTVVTTLEHGAFTLADDEQSVAIRDNAGRILDSLPLTFTLDGQRFPLLQQIVDEGHALRLTPDLTRLDRTAPQPVASPLENQLAMNDLINAVSLGTSIGSLIGTAIGAVAGVGVGLALAGASCLVLSLGCVVTVLPIVSLAAAAGGIAGLVLAGGPTAAAAALNYWSILRTEPSRSQYAPQVQGKPGGVPAEAAN
ncbi:hypothetical protein KO481_16140 [Nocardia sp. NEAU-G5]|uniref:DUF8020 domain-containing protein n=1 Tax=Nocardia albiluteola TaxID=2842303 RepID=A0ABS6AYC2_9NOCA|nr:hypothetical protein [Nocardia albiluteola]MBU3063050.1 hypothetical protein [Nocardia albiluteola]